MTRGQSFTITLSSRTPGKHFSRQSRTAGEIPAVIYGPKTKPLNVLLKQNEAVRYGKHGFENTIFTVDSASPELKGMKIMRKALDIHPVTRLPIHMDFFAPDMTKSVRVSVEVRFTGKAAGTTDGGLVSIAQREVEIECLPTEIPEFFELDVTPMGLNESLHVSDLNLPATIKLISSPTETLVTCAIVEEVKAAALEAGAPAVGAAAPATGAAAPAAAPAAGAGGAKKA